MARLSGLPYMILTRLGYFLSLWLIVIGGTFILFHLVPVDPARAMLGPNASQDQVSAVRRDLGLDRALHTQFFSYLARVARLELGHSFVDGRPVLKELVVRLTVSLVVAFQAVMLIAAYLAILVLARMIRFGRGLSEMVSFVCICLPTLFVAVLVAVLTVSSFPYMRFSGTFERLDDWLYLLPPAFVLALYPMGVLGRIMNAQIEEATMARYSRTADAMGLSRGRRLWSYVLRNATIPMVAAFGNQLPLLLTSTFIVELVFSVPGLGALLLRSVLERDFPMMEGIVLVTSALVLVTNLSLEIIYPLADPRVRDP